MPFQQISPSEFFYNNRDLAGFSNPARALYTSVREFVENSLDACDHNDILPDIKLDIKYDGEEKKQEPAQQQLQATDNTTTTTSKKKNGKSEKSDKLLQQHYTLSVKDNGPGMESDIIPQAFGTVLYGSKFGLKQARGMFGLGATMSILYGQITTNKPVIVGSSVADSDIWHEYHMLLDIKKNKPIIQKHTEKKCSKSKTGLAVAVSLEGDYAKAGSKIRNYIHQTCLITPYASITFTDPREKIYEYKRFVNEIPPPPTITLTHPHGVDVERLKRLIDLKPQQKLVNFLTKNFQRVGAGTAKKFAAEAKLDPQQKMNDYGPSDIVTLAEALVNYDWPPPDPTCLAPLGADKMQAGLEKFFECDFVETIQRKPSAYGGYPFVVEMGIAYGTNEEGKEQQRVEPFVYRFANRIPLLYDEGSDILLKVVKETDWHRYKVSQPGNVTIVSHICSTRIPYKTAGKENVADRPEIEKELRLAMQFLLRKLSGHMSKLNKAKMEKKRSSMFAKYMPMVSQFSTKLARKKKEPNMDVFVAPRF